MVNSCWKLSENNQLRIALILFFLLSSFNLIFAQDQSSSKYMVIFKDKSCKNFDYQSYFDKKALDRRLLHQLPPFDYTDLPVDTSYIEKLGKLTDSVKMVSRWFNAVVCFSDKSVEDFMSLSFVKEVIKLGSMGYLTADEPGLSFKQLSSDQRKLLDYQIERMHGNLFAKNGIDGSGVRIAVFDAGFKGAKENQAFKHLFGQNRVFQTYDFVKKKVDVFDYDDHGTMVLSCIGGMVDSINIGLASGSEYLLARTENAHVEPFSEEENWLAAAEWADRHGADIINSSLGYTFHRYFANQMDGKTSLVSRAASMAAAKGILVVNSAGNEGLGNWHYLGTPADADSVLTVGAIHPSTNYHTAFSSYGPTADKRLKPNVCAVGHVIAAKQTGFNSTQGTSFSSPLIAGFAACVKQIKDTIKNMELFKEIENSADLFPYFDYAHGYGVPQADYFFNKPVKQLEPTFDVEKNHKVLKVKIRQAFRDTSSKPINRLDALGSYLIKKTSMEDYFYYHIENEQGVLDDYYVIDFLGKEELLIDLSGVKNKSKIRLHYKHYTLEYLL